MASNLQMAEQRTLMRKTIFSLLLACSSLSAFSQFHIGLFGGASHYQGDLVSRVYVGPLTRSAIGITANYEFSERIMIRGGFTHAKVAGSDQYNSKEYLKARNLSFESSISELSIMGEFYTFSLYDKRWSPYVFAGLAAYRFNPYTFDSTNKVYLQPLGTEGQGLPGYHKQYALTQLALPFGGGIKFAISDRVRVGAEIGLRKLFTDYLDDISTNYAGEDELLAGRGQQAVDLAYRADEYPGGDPAYPAKGSQRGSAAVKDWYYFSGVHLTFRLGGNGGSGSGRSRRSQYGCPAVPL